LDVMTFGRAALACYFTFIAVFYTAKLMALRARTGRRHADAGAPGTAQWVSHRLFVVLRGAIWLLCVARVAAPDLDRWLGPIDALSHPAVIAAGLGLLLVSLSGVVYVHSYLGDAWRSGVGASGPTMLITTGPYAQVRHPLFLAVAVGQLGFFLALPSLFALACLALGLTVLLLQGRYEERRMEERFGAAWRSYAERTSAIWPPGGPGLPSGGVREG
jgi:protein-S-isoprenylcysteine O-methyltransferase Ste14